MKILTREISPPIPVRQFDWQAWYAGEEDEQMDQGFGPTPEAAINDLVTNYVRDGRDRR